MEATSSPADGDIKNEVVSVEPKKVAIKNLGGTKSSGAGGAGNLAAQHLGTSWQLRYKSRPQV